MNSKSPLAVEQAFIKTAAYSVIVNQTNKATREQIKRGEIPATKAGDEWRIPVWFVEQKLACTA